MARGLKFRIYKEEGLYYSCSENKDADQLRGDLRLCFRKRKKPVFSQRGSFYSDISGRTFTGWLSFIQRVALNQQVDNTMWKRWGSSIFTLPILKSDFSIFL